MNESIITHHYQALSRNKSRGTFPVTPVTGLYAIESRYTLVVWTHFGNDRGTSPIVHVSSMLMVIALYYLVHQGICYRECRYYLGALRLPLAVGAATVLDWIREQCGMQSRISYLGKGAKNTAKWGCQKKSQTLQEGATLAT